MEVDHPVASIWLRAALYIVLGVAVLAAVVLIGRHTGDEIRAMERWITELGPWGPIAFVVLAVLFTSLFVPDTLVAMAAGALFGLFWGALWMVLAAMIAALVDFWLSRWLLRGMVMRTIDRLPRLAAVEQAASGQGVRLLLLLRMTPLNPATLSYVLGASRVKFGPFLVACLGLVPALFVEVYFGYVAVHVARIAGNVNTHPRLHTLLTVAGFVICVVVVVYVTIVARRALVEVECGNGER